MTPEETKAAAEVMLSGGPWQVMSRAVPHWVDINCPSWDWSVCKYRQKPQKIVRYIVIPHSKYGFESKADAQSYHGNGYGIACIRVEFEPGQFDE